MNIDAIPDYNSCDTYFHAINESDLEALLIKSNGNIQDIKLYGRVFDPDMSLLDAESEQQYDNVEGEGYIYAVGYEERMNVTPGASSLMGCPILMLGYDGNTHCEPVSLYGSECLVPVNGYRVIGRIQ